MPWSKWGAKPQISQIFTDRVSVGGNAIASVCPSVSTLSFEPIDLWPWPFACVWVMTIAVFSLKVKVNPNSNPAANPNPKTQHHPNAVDLTSILDRGQFSSCTRQQYFKCYRFLLERNVKKSKTYICQWLFFYIITKFGRFVLFDQWLGASAVVLP